MQQMLTCSNCGSQNAANQQFCVSCGAHLGNPIRQPHVPIVTGVVTTSPMMGNVMQAQPMATQVLPPAPRQTAQLEVKPTWGLAWGLFWRGFFLLLFVGAIAFLVYMLVRMILGYNSVFGTW
jgi:hypothetical protein